MWLNLVVTMAQPTDQWSSKICQEEIEVITRTMMDVNLHLDPCGGSSSMKVKLQESAIRSPVNSNKLSTRSCTSQAWTEQPMLDQSGQFGFLLMLGQNSAKNNPTGYPHISFIGGQCEKYWTQEEEQAQPCIGWTKRGNFKTFIKLLKQYQTISYWFLMNYLQQNL